MRRGVNTRYMKIHIFNLIPNKRICKYMRESEERDGKFEGVGFNFFVFGEIGFKASDYFYHCIILKSFYYKFLILSIRFFQVELI